MRPVSTQTAPTCGFFVDGAGPDDLARAAAGASTAAAAAGAQAGATACGPPAGLTFVVKDSFDVAGLPTGNGSPHWRASHPPAAATAPAVRRLLAAGATLVGKTMMDEMAYSLFGENAHYGAPPNPAAPGRVPGGSSSGAAAAVAAGAADFGLGGDTAGSVRVPAAFCGVLGFRPTHGRAPLQGSCPLAPSFDTAGLVARSPAVLRAAAGALLDECGRAATPLRRWLVARDAFALAGGETCTAVYGALSSRLAAVQGVLGRPHEIDLAAGVEGGLPGWLAAFRTVQAWEVWREHGDWVRQQRPAFGPGVRERFEAAARVTRAEYEAAAAVRVRVTAHLDALLGDDGVLALPTVPGPAPPLRCAPAAADAVRAAIMQLTCAAGLAGLPQVSLPVAQVEGLPVALGLVGPRGCDEALLQLAEALMGALGGAGE